MDETLEVGCDMGEPVLEDYGPRDNAFSGKVNLCRSVSTLRPSGTENGGGRKAVIEMQRHEDL